MPSRKKNATTVPVDGELIDKLLRGRFGSVRTAVKVIKQMPGHDAVEISSTTMSRVKQEAKANPLLIRAISEALGIREEILRGQEPLSTGRHRLQKIPTRIQPFVGREAELKSLSEELTKGDVCISGFGGSGKSAIAIEYAHLHINRYPGGIAYLSCESLQDAPEQISAALASLAPHLGIDPHQSETAILVKHAIENGEKCLLILDDVTAQFWHSDPVAECLPTRSCRYLLTTRDNRLSNVHSISVDRLPNSDGLELTRRFRSVPVDDAIVVERILDLIDGYTLGIVCIGIYMQHNAALTWSDYEESLRERVLSTVAETQGEIEFASGRYSRRVDCIFADLFSCLQDVEVDLLKYSAVMPEDATIGVWFSKLLPENPANAPPGYKSAKAGTVALRSLEATHLIRRVDVDLDLVSVHGILRDYVLTILDKDERRALVWAILQMGGDRQEELGRAASNPRNRFEFTALSKLAYHAFSLFPNYIGQFGIGLIMPGVDYALFDRGCFAAAREHFMRQLTIHTYLQGDPAAVPEHLLLQLARVAFYLTEFDWALHLLKDIYNSNQYACQAYALSAMILSVKGAFGQAQRMLADSIERSKNEDPLTLYRCYSDWGIAYQIMGNASKAVEHLHMAVETEKEWCESKKTFGIAESLWHLGKAYAELGQTDPARQNFQRSIEVFEDRMGPTHPHLGARYTELSTFEFSNGQIESALAWGAKSCTIAELYDQDPRSSATSYLLMSQSHAALGDHRKGINWCLRFFESLENCSRHNRISTAEKDQMSVVANMTLSQLHLELGEFVDAAAALASAWQADRQSLQSAEIVANALVGLCERASVTGDVAAATQCSKLATDLASFYPQLESLSNICSAAIVKSREK